MPYAYAPRGMGLEEAARYIGVGRTKFLELVQQGRMPTPRQIDGRRVWDTRQLDDAFDALSDPQDRSPWDEVAA